MAKLLTDRTEIAKAINFGKYPVLTLDMNNHGGFDDNDYCIGCDVRCEYETSRYGKMHTQGHLYIENGKFGVSNNATCLHSSFGYKDIKEMTHWANTPVIKADQDVVVIYDFGNAAAVEILHTGKRVDPNCMTAITLNHIED